METLQLVKIVLVFFGILSLSIVILLSYIFSSKIYELLKIIPILLVWVIANSLNKKFFHFEPKTLTFIYGSSLISSLLFYIFFGKKTTSKDEKEKKYTIRLEHEGGVIVYDNPFNGFLVYGGAEAGKTSSIGKPLLKEFMRNNFSLFIYDAKDSDYTLTASKIKNDINYPYPIFNLDFFDATKSSRTNIFSKKVISDDILVPVFAEIFFSSFLKDDEKKDEWFDMALGVFKGVTWVFYQHHSDICTLPHICNFIQYANVDQLKAFISKDRIGQNYASALFESEGSEKTQSSILVNLSKTIANFSANKNVSYVLSGDDFEFTLADPTNPKTICVSNNFMAREVISPVVVLLFVALAKQIKFGNQTPIAFFMDEATTFKIPDLEAYPSELREYMVSFVLLTQSAGKIEKKYSKYDRSSLESNLANQFYGWTADIIALENYAKQFSKIDEKYKSFTRSSNSKQSTTTSSRKEIRYDGEFFGTLKPGEFVGKAKNANIPRFHTRFKPYKGGKADSVVLPRIITKEDIDKNYEKIIKDIEVLL
ncbi:type IV secretory system conjugative DNA transfer family protein [Chryseobacterium potabilaquae]|uniref:Type IV secretory system conjugative DNA transfer family protein n=1 Tax=Chryseobacterium potabilaquae TaxID=2675057 RepID=A0A6N4XFL2_9FLAO|nr:type IV secretory system conjugative DNA transfer family protein [Chryseobacterium potabilaquae]CAA7197447.1 hypothetical protein CHRY9293_03506 [Chryseobacterium potabilaquae]